MIEGKRVALVIQGPLTSSGNSGSGTIIRDFDCTAGILKLIADSDSVVDGYVLSTWRGGSFPAASAKLKVVVLDDPGPQKAFFSRMPTNEFRQAYGCHGGVEVAIREFAPDYVLKVRTDQLVDVPALIAHMVQTDAQFSDPQPPAHRGLLYFPNMLSWSPYSVGDFYIGGHAGVVLDFFAAQLEYSGHSFSNAWPWVHSDIVLRHAYRNLRGELDLPDLFFFPNVVPAFRVDLHGVPPGVKYHRDVLKLWARLLEREISFFPKGELLKMAWRGEMTDASRHDLGEFYEDWLIARRDAQKWMASKYPKLYSPARAAGGLSNRLSRLVDFNAEKADELAGKQPAASRHLWRIARAIATLCLLQCPREEFFLKVWLRMKSATRAASRTAPR